EAERSTLGRVSREPSRIVKTDAALARAHLPGDGGGDPRRMVRGGAEDAGRKRSVCARRTRRRHTGGGGPQSRRGYTPPGRCVSQVAHRRRRGGNPEVG